MRMKAFWIASPKSKITSELKRGTKAFFLSLLLPGKEGNLFPFSRRRKRKTGRFFPQDKNIIITGQEGRGRAFLIFFQGEKKKRRGGGLR